MNDAERVAHVMWPAPSREGSPLTWDQHIAAAQRLIDSGVVTVHPPPDPAELVMNEFVRRWSPPMGAPADDVLRSMLDDGWIDPGPRCDQ